jgi:hypothetical protein
VLHLQRLNAWLTSIFKRLIIPGHGSWPAILWPILIYYPLSSHVSSNTEQTFRIWGAALQIGGLWAAAVGLNDKRAEFGLPSLLPGVLRGLKLPHWPKHHVLNATAVGTLNAVVGVATAVSRAAPRTLEERISQLEADLQSANKLIDATRSELLSKVGELKSGLDRETNERRTTDEQHAISVARLMVGNIALEVTGLFWLTLGMLFGTVPQDLVQLWTWFTLKPAMP